MKNTKLRLLLEQAAQLRFENYSYELFLFMNARDYTQCVLNECSLRSSMLVVMCELEDLGYDMTLPTSNSTEEWVTKAELRLAAIRSAAYKSSDTEGAPAEYISTLKSIICFYKHQLSEVRKDDCLSV